MSLPRTDTSRPEEGTRLCACSRPVFQGMLPDIPWMCVECGMLVPIGERLRSYGTLATEKPRTVRRSSLNLEWPKSVTYIDNDEVANQIISHLRRSASDDPRRDDTEGGEDTAEVLSILDEADQPPARQSFPYGSLADDEIRILYLPRGKPDDPLHGELKRVKVYSTSVADNYEAISYTWSLFKSDGAHDRTMHMPLYLGKNWTRLAITRNCDAALRRLRSADEDKKLWVDAICINQNDNIEKPKQVTLMEIIFRNADSVLVYLGEGSEDTGLAFDALSVPRYDLKWKLQDDHYRSALGRFFDLPYFSRVWIIQELVLAKNIILYTSRHRQTINKSHLKQRINDCHELGFTGINMPLWLTAKREEQLGDWIFSGMTSHASVPADMVFAFLGLITEDIKRDIDVNYDFAVEQVYTGFASFLAAKGYLLSLLQNASSNTLETGHLKLDLPSWVPDFRAKLTAYSRSPLENRTPRMYFKPVCSTISVLQKIGSLVLHGHIMLMEKTLNTSQSDLLSEDLGPLIKISPKHAFLRDTDCFFLCPAVDTYNLSLHLRKIEYTKDCYNFIGLCEFDISPADYLRHRPTTTNSSIRNIVDEMSPVTTVEFCAYWHVYSFILKNPRLRETFGISTRTSRFDHSEEAWNGYQSYIRYGVAHNVLGKWSRSEMYEIVQLWENGGGLVHKTRRRRVERLASFIMNNLPDKLSSYSSLCDDWLTLYHKVILAAYNFIGPNADDEFGPSDKTTEEAFDRSLKLRTLISHWRELTMQWMEIFTTSGLNRILFDDQIEAGVSPSHLDQNMEERNSNIEPEESAFFIRGKNIRLSTTESVAEIFDAIESGIKSENMALQDELVQRKNKDPVAKKNQPRRAWFDLIQDWRQFQETLGLIPDPMTVTIEVIQAFEIVWLFQDKGWEIGRRKRELHLDKMNERRIFIV
ncbi:heterokaryon incompatibility protein-domain-containing protein [Nemania sp. NC0429]|nr:heterokaryon incompatibility protein-domain-containing protein [Nemania sp. NC0429]